MFNFMGKKEKKSRKGLTTSFASSNGDEIENNLEELRRSLKLKPGKRKEKVKLPSGITADYSSAFFAQLDSDKASEQDRGQEEVTLQNSTALPVTSTSPRSKNPPIPPRGILKNAKTKYSSDTGQKISANNSPDGSASIENFVNSLSTKYELTSEYTFQMSSENDTNQSQNAWSTKSHSVHDGQYPLPEITFRPLLPVRTLTIKRSHEHGFGFSLRKVGITDRSDSSMRFVIFAEPSKSDSGLIPGDRLLRVNGIAVENFSMEKIVEMIRNSGDKIVVEVQPIAELTELALRCNSLDYHLEKMSYSERTQNENGKHEEAVWLMHRGGYSSAKVINSNDTGKVSIALDNGEQISVDEFSVSTKNPEDLDFAEDICQLKYLNEPSVIHSVRSRFTNNLIHTRAGPTLIVVNPMAHLPIYSEKIISALKACKSDNMPPHIYSLAQSSYREMLDTRRDQSLIFIGNSASGKSTSFKHAIFYLTLMAGSNKVLNAEKINAIHTILDHFGNSQTPTNANATRFTQVFNINFDHIGQIVSASIQVLLMDKFIISRRNKKVDASVDVITKLVVGVEGNLKKELLLDSTNFGTDNNVFVNIPSQLEARQKLSEEFKSLTLSFQILGIDEKILKAIWSVLAAIYHLGSASVCRGGSNNRIQFENAVSAKRAANLLGVSVEKLHDLVFSSLGKTSSIEGEDKELSTAMYTIEGLVTALYNEIFSTIISLINKEISTSANSVASIVLIDSPGLQIQPSNQTASLDDLKNNYLQERLQQLFHHVHLMMPHDRYSQEMIEISVERICGFSSLVNLIDQSPRNHHVTKSPKQNENEKSVGLGLFCLLDDESSQFNSNEESFLQKFFTIFNDESSKMIMKKGPGKFQFWLHHFQGTNPVLYSAKGWLKECQNVQFAKNAINLLQESGRDEIITLINEGFKVGSYNTLKDGTQSLRRVSSIRRSFGSVNSKRNSSMLQIKLTVDGLIDTLRRTKTHFIHCFTPHNIHSEIDGENLGGNFIDIPQLSSQVRGSLIIEVARLHRNGFPENVPIDEFVRRYGLLSSETSKESLNVETILKSNESEIDVSAYRVGSTQIFFRAGVLNKLERKLLESLTDRIIQLQAYCRGNLARKRVQKKKVQLLAVRCIQRNVRAFISIRDWPWWRLLIRVNPLLNVHRAEEKLKIACGELHTLKLKLEKVESDRNFLKQENQSLEGKLSEMTLELVEERTAVNLANERLDVEHGERIKLEKELDDQKEKYFNLQDASEKLELELLCAKSDINSVSEDEIENEDAGSVYRLKYERAVRELEYTRKRLQTQHEHDLEQLVGLKKQLEKKLADAFEEIDEQRKVVAQWKRKNQKQAGDMNDLRILLDEQNARNNILEKKQRKFDSELQGLQDNVKIEKQAKEKLSKENHALMTEKYQIEQSLADAQNDLEMNIEKVSSLTKELNELTFHSNTEEEVAQLKRMRHDLDKKCKDQEEELDEQAAQIQLLEQAKLKLEMTLETMRKDIRRESQQQNEEIEDIRSTSYKKIKSLECQLEHEHEERTLLLREKHELERRLNLLEDQDRTERAAEEATIKKLKQDLRKCKALLRDSQCQLERAKSDASGKALVRQLRNQLEDAESAKLSAVRLRQIAESELSELQTTLDEIQRSKHESEEKVSIALRDLKELQTQLDENEEEMNELMRKYSLIVKQLSGEQAIVSDYQIRISDLESDISMLKQQNSDLTARLECFESSDDKNSTILNKRLEMRVKEMESKLEFEQITKARFETQVSRLKDNLEKSQHEISIIRSKEMQAQDGLKKSQKSLRDLREEFQSRLNREQEEISKRKELEKRLELSLGESVSLKNDMRLALKRISDLQQALNDDQDSDELDDDDGSSLSSSDSDGIGDDITESAK